MFFRQSLYWIISVMVTFFHEFVFRKSKRNGLELLKHYAEVLDTHEIDMMLSTAGLRLTRTTPPKSDLDNYEVRPVKPSLCADDPWIRYTPRNAWLYVVRDKVDMKGFPSFIFAVMQRAKQYKKDIKVQAFVGTSRNPLYTFSPVFLIDDPKKEFLFGALPGKFLVTKRKDAQLLSNQISIPFVKGSTGPVLI